MKIDGDAARAAIEAQVARRFGLGVEEAAAGLLRVVDAVMAENVKVVSVKQGHDPRDFALVAFGGAGPTHAGALMSELQVPAVLVPPSPGTLCALGLLQTDLRHDGVRTHLRRLDTADPDELARIVAALAGEGRAELAAQGVAVERVELRITGELRYAGQAYEVAVTIDDPHDRAELARRFHAEHERLYAHSLPESVVELVALRVTALGTLPRPAATRLAGGGLEPPAAARLGARPVYFEEAGGWVDCAIYDRAGLLAGNRLAGPAIVEQMDTTTVLFPGQTAEVHATGTLIIRSAHG